MIVEIVALKSVGHHSEIRSVDQDHRPVGIDNSLRQLVGREVHDVAAASVEELVIAITTTDKIDHFVWTVGPNTGIVCRGPATVIAPVIATDVSAEPMVQVRRGFG